MLSFFSFLTDPSLQSGLLKGILGSPLFFILMDVLSGVISSLRAGTFQWKSLVDFLRGDILKYLGGSFGLGVASSQFNWHTDAQIVASLLVMLGLNGAIFASVLENISELFPPSVQPILKEVEQDIQNAQAAPASPVTAQASSTTQLMAPRL